MWATRKKKKKKKELRTDSIFDPSFIRVNLLFTMKQDERENANLSRTQFPIY